MDSILHELVGLLVALGPWIIFAVTLAETAFFLGLLVPAEATVLVGAFLADRGIFSAADVFAAAFFGGLLGDQIGYLLGRYGGARMAARGGRLGRMWDRYAVAVGNLFRRHAALAVTLARFLSFVRTLMPWSVGMDRMPYPRFLFYDVLGVLGWAAGSVALGYLAGESWRVAARALGTIGASALALALTAAAWAALRRRAGQRLRT